MSRYLRDEMDTGFIDEALKRNHVDEAYDTIVDDLLKHEYSHGRFDENREVNPEIGISISIRTVLQKNSPDERRERNNALSAMMWRIRVQSVAFEAYMALYDEGLVDLSALQYDVDFHHNDETVWAVVQALSRSFEFGEHLTHTPDVALCLTSMSWNVPEVWLACMLVRGALAPLESIVDFLALNGTLGAFDAAIFRKWWSEGKELKVDPMAQALIPSCQQGFVGVHLPMGLSFPCKLEDIYYAIDEPLRKCEEIFARYFKIPEMVFVPAGRIWMP